MDLLDKKVTADWIDIREKLTVPARLKSYLKLEQEGLVAEAKVLRTCTLGGPVEYKRKLIQSVFSFLTRLEFQTPTGQDIEERELVLRQLIYVNSLEYLFALGQLRPQRDAGGENTPTSGGAPPVPLEDIVREVTARLNANPELAKDSRVKTILMEVQLYKKEYDQFKQLSPKIPDDRAAGFLANFQKRISDIVGAIRGQYEELLASDRRELSGEQAKKEEEIFLVPGLNRLLMTQTQELSLLRSTVNFALQEGYQMRALLVRLTTRKDPVLALVEEEGRLWESWGRQITLPDAAVRLARNLALTLQRQ